MRPRLLKDEIDYAAQEWVGINTSGYRPIGDLVLVLPDQAAEKTEGGIYLTESTQQTHNLAVETGVIVALGTGAFSWNPDRMRPFEGEKPQIGDRVIFERYAGRRFQGEDDKIYQLMTDKEIGAIQGAQSTSTEGAEQ